VSTGSSSEAFGGDYEKHWGRALDLYYMILVGAEEAGADFDRRHTPADGYTDDLLFEVLAGLHARACRTAGEIHALLSAGFPYGALARCRTLHELGAQRFLDHDAVLRHQDAIAYQKNCTVLGADPFSPEEMAEWREDYDAILAQYGKNFRQPYGWAEPLTSSVRSFTELEHLADVSHLRSYFRWASHEIHSDARGWVLNQHEWNGELYRLTGRTGEGLADPGSLGVISLLQSTVKFSRPRSGGCAWTAGPRLFAYAVALGRRLSHGIRRRRNCGGRC
jgi:hypothetical protein